MMIRMAIADNNRAYVDRLLNGLEQYEELNLSVYTDKNSLENALRTKRFDILLFVPSLYDGQITLDQNTLAILLFDEAETLPDSCRDFLKIQKYQRVNHIYKRILELYADVCQDTGRLSGTGRTRMIAFYSPIGGSGKTTLSLAVASRLAMQGFQTFYLNLEDIASDDCYLPATEQKGMSELLGCLETESNLTLKLKGMSQLKADNFYYLNHFSTPNDIYEMQEDELEALLSGISGSGLYDYILVDMGVSLDDKALKVFDCADKIVVIEKSDAIAVRKLECFLSQTHIINEYGSKMLRILNFGTGIGSCINSDIPLTGTIHMMQTPNIFQLITIMSSSGIDGLIKELMG